jgi:hypothetical protein
VKRSGFKSKGFTPRPAKEIAYTPRPRAAATTAAQMPALIKPQPKNPPGRSQAYRDLARGQPCMVQIPEVCCGNTETTVLAHSNEGVLGKGMAMKADDAIGSAWACFTCHSWVDQGPAPAESKKAAMAAAFERQVQELERIVGCNNPRDRAAAQWALDRIRLLAR